MMLFMMMTEVWFLGDPQYAVKIKYQLIDSKENLASKLIK